MTAQTMPPVPVGWVPESWVARLEPLAAACSIPARAAELRCEADAIRQAHGLEPTDPPPARVQPPPHASPSGSARATGRPSRHPTSTHPPPRQLMSPTSIAGGRHVAPVAGRLARLALALLERAGPRGLPRQELAEVMSRRLGRPVKEGTICARAWELMGAGLVVEPGQTRSGATGARNGVLVHQRHAPAHLEAP